MRTYYIAHIKVSLEVAVFYQQDSI